MPDEFYLNHQQGCIISHLLNAASSRTSSGVSQDYYQSNQNRVASSNSSPMLATSVACGQKCLMPWPDLHPDGARRWAPTHQKLLTTQLWSRGSHHDQIPAMRQWITLAWLKEHGGTCHHADDGAVQQSQQPFLGQQSASGAAFKFAQRHAANGHCQRLAAACLLDCPARTGKKAASTTIWSMVD